MTPEQQIAVINRCPPGMRPVAVTVPTRAFRVVALDGDLVFRVEQLEAGSWEWKARSTHAGDEEFEAFGPALQDAINKQEEFKLKIRQAQIAQRQAMRVAEAEGLKPSGI